MITGSIDTTRLDLAMDSLADVLVGSGADASNLVRDEARRLNRTIVNFVPPQRSRWGTAKTSGEMAIRAELTSLFSEAAPALIDDIGSRYGIHNVKTTISKEDGSKLNLDWANIDPEATRMDQYHAQYQNRRGKIPRVKAAGPGTWKARVIIPYGSREPFIKKIQQRVGRMRASMAACGAALGEKYPSWISRHLGSVQGISIVETGGLQNTIKPSVTFGSRAPGINRISDRVQGAVNFRAKVIARRIKLMLSGYKEDIWRGMKAQTRERRTATEPFEVVE